eukprot:scaffold143929_cov17-Prasinocladus_malaysianus.AAC.1
MAASNETTSAKEAEPAVITIHHHPSQSEIGQGAIIVETKQAAAPAMRIHYKLSLSSYEHHRQQQPFSPIKRAAEIDICGGALNDNTLDRF